MSSDNEDLFFDAESDISLKSLKAGDTSEESDDTQEKNSNVDMDLKKTREQLKGLRCRLLNKEEDEEELQSPESPVSSVDGVYATSKTTKFRVVETDTVSIHSMMSLGRVGAILGNPNPDVPSVKDPRIPLYMKNTPLVCRSTAASRENLSREVITRSKSVSDLETNMEKPNSMDEEKSASQNIELKEPDIVASTKSTAPADTEMKEPVPPPRKKKKGKISRAVSEESLQLLPDKVLLPTEDPEPTVIADKSDMKDTEALPPAADKPDATSNIVRLQPSSKIVTTSVIADENRHLDIGSAKRGLYVVKPQDEPSTKATGSSDPSEPLKQETENNCEDKQLLVLGSEVRLRSDSGKPLSDKEILDQLTVLNLDTGERVPLSEAEDKIPKCVNPLSLHIMRLTSEYVGNSPDDKSRDSDEESVDFRRLGTEQGLDDGDTVSLKKKTLRIGRVIGSTVRKTIVKAKKVAKGKQKEEAAMDLPDEANVSDQFCKMKASSSHKGPYEFDTVQCIQDLSGQHIGPVWCMKFSLCGRLLATAGQDKVLRVWVLKSAFNYFLDMRTKYNADNKVSPTPSNESLKSQQSLEEFRTHSRTLSLSQDPEAVNIDPTAPFMPRPFCVYAGHTADVLDLSWSKNYFVLSSSMDKTVRLWHISRKECLCCFQHIDFVTAIAFHPKDDRYFLSGSLDGKLRLWNIPDKKVEYWNELDGPVKLITAANFCQNGNFAVVGSYDGRCIFYTTENLKYHTQIHVRSTRGKNSIGRKITGIEPLPGEDKVLVTSNDSRLRLYDLRDCSPSCKYRGSVNNSSQIRATFSHDGKFIICGSENQCLYMWKTHHDYAKFSSVRRDRNNFWEAIRAHNAVVTSAIFAPEPQIIIDFVEYERKPKENPFETPMQRSGSQSTVRFSSPNGTIPQAGWAGYVMVSADYNGSIKVFMNKTKPKHSSLPASALF